MKRKKRGRFWLGTFEWAMIILLAIGWLIVAFMYYVMNIYF